MKGTIALAIATATVGDLAVPYLSIGVAFRGKVAVTWRILLAPADARTFLTDLAATVRHLGFTHPTAVQLPCETPDGEVRVFPRYPDVKQVGT